VSTLRSVMLLMVERRVRDSSHCESDAHELWESLDELWRSKWMS
jgi:hypothetical protein